MKEQQQTLKKHVMKQINKLPDKELEALIIRMLTEFEKGIGALKDFSQGLRRAPGVPPQWWRCCSFPSPRLEQDIKKLKADLQASRQVEQELRSQISSLSSTERGIRSEMGQLRQENELLQNKYVHLVDLRQGA